LESPQDVASVGIVEAQLQGGQLPNRLEGEPNLPGGDEPIDLAEYLGEPLGYDAWIDSPFGEM